MVLGHVITIAEIEAEAIVGIEAGIAAEIAARIDAKIDARIAAKIPPKIPVDVRRVKRLTAVSR